MKILLDYGTAKDIKYDSLKKIIAEGSVKKYSETINLAGDSRNDLGKLPYQGIFPICDWDDCVYFEPINGDFVKHD